MKFNTLSKYSLLTSWFLLSCSISQPINSTNEQHSSDSIHIESVTNQNNKEEKISISKVKTIIQQHCVECHSINPTKNGLKSAPSGVLFDTEEQITSKAQRINARAVVAKDMPPNQSHVHDDGSVEHHGDSKMTERDRELLGLWVSQISN